MRSPSQNDNTNYDGTGGISLANCIIFCAADFDRLLAPICPGDYLIAADGGLRHTQALNLTPHCILGDFDSLGYTPRDAQVFPVEKDDTDSMLAVRRGLQLGYRRFLLYGSLDGPRLDHTVANFQTLQYLSDHGALGYLVGRTYLATVIKDCAAVFPAGAAGIISVFCIGADARGVSIRGLKYPLENGTLTAGFPLGVSNHFTGATARIQVDHGSLLLLWDRANGLPNIEEGGDVR
jgi:thiamine pyrophosphokinase